MRHGPRRTVGVAAALGTLIAAVGALPTAAAENETPGERKPSWLPSRERALIVCVVQDESR